ncbi:MAG: hypothetical protein ACC653_12055 [Gammaproteobacteria bacterium]
MLLNIKSNFAFLMVSGLLLQNANALEVDREVMPRITVGGQVIATADDYGYSKNLPSNHDDNVSTDDSALLLRFDKHMYGVESGVAGGVIGFREFSGKVVFHQLNAFYWNKNIEFQIGKTRLRNTIIELPTLRDEDLLDYSHVNTASSDEEFDQLYGSNVSLDWYLDQANQSLGIWAGSRNNDVNHSSGPNSFDTNGVRYNYQPPEDLQYLNRIRHAGILIDSQRVQTGAVDEWMQSVVAGIEFNLNINPTSSWSMGVQAISNAGVDSATDLSTVSSRALSKSTAQIISLRYTRRPQLLTRWQVAIVVASKKYDKVSNAKNTSLLVNYTYRLGQGVNIITQVKQTDYSNDINSGNDETLIQIGMSFQFDSVFNNTIGKRNSILNLEHGYIQ